MSGQQQVAQPLGVPQPQLGGNPQVQQGVAGAQQLGGHPQVQQGVGGAQQPGVGGGAPPVQPQHFGGAGHGFAGFNQGQGYVGQQNFGAVPGQYAVYGHGMYNVQHNANFAWTAASIADQKARMAMQNCDNLAKTFAKNERWAKDLKINQEMVKYKSPADKKAVKYLMEEQFDLKELHSTLKTITPDDNSQPIITANNCQLVEATIKFVVDHLQMRLRKRSLEEESYRIARESTFGWMTEKRFRQDPIFVEEDLDDDSLWYQKPELSREKKAERLRTAERDVRFHFTNVKKQQFQQFRPKGLVQQFGQPRQFQQNNFPPQFRHPYARPDTRKCNNCGVIGHISRNCFSKPRQPFQQNFVHQGRGTRPQGQHQGVNQQGGGN